MSNGHNCSDNSNNSHSESSNSSPNQVQLIRDKELTDLTLFGASTPTLNRTGTVRRASVASTRRESSFNGDDTEAMQVCPRSSPERAERYRKSLDSTYRLSLESISEHKPQNAFSTTSLFPSREGSSMESSSSDNTDCALRSGTESVNRDQEGKTLMSPASSYLSWIESVNSEYFGNTATAAEVPDVDNKVGEWNNFWLNYNSARNRYMVSPYVSTSNEDRTGDELSDVKSTCSTQKEFNEKSSTEYITLSLEEISEAIKCSQRITEILQHALKRHDRELDDSKNDSYYSQALSFLSKQNSIKEDVMVKRERSYSYAAETLQEQQKQKKLLQNAQSSSSSCINALLNTGVADILKRVITKRRDQTASTAPDNETPIVTARSSFSDWPISK